MQFSQPTLGNQVMAEFFKKNAGEAGAQATLTQRQQDVLARTAWGERHKGIIKSLHLTETMDMNHVSDILEKVMGENRTQAGNIAWR